MLAEARAVYLAVKDDAAAVASIRAERTALAKAVAFGDGAGLEVTSATVNGQTFGVERTMTKEQRLRLLGLVLKMVDTGTGTSVSSTGYMRHGL